MAELEQVQKLVAEVGPLVRDIELIQQLDDDRWLLMFDNEDAFEIECDTTANKLTFSAILAPVADAHKAEFYEALLNYNFLWRETGGLRMALDGMEKNVVLLFDLFRLDLNARTLAAVVGKLRDTALTWREAIEGDGRPAVDAAADVADMLRV